MSYFKSSQHIYDTLIRLLPNIKDRITNYKKDVVNSNAAKSLYSIWRTSENRLNEDTYKRPTNVGWADVENMQKEGLVRSIGDKIEITDKGKQVIKVMILGDDRSSFEDDHIIIDYNQALSNTKDVKIAKIRHPSKK